MARRHLAPLGGWRWFLLLLLLLAASGGDGPVRVAAADEPKSLTVSLRTKWQVRAPHCRAGAYMPPPPPFLYREIDASLAGEGGGAPFCF